MFRKAGFKKMALSFVVAIALASGVASIGYCGGGAGAPPGDPTKESGPSINCIMVINGLSTTGTEVPIDTIIVVGKCNGQEIAVMRDLGGGLVPVSSDDLGDGNPFLNGESFGNGQELLGVSSSDPCFPTHGTGTTFGDFLVIDNVSSFSRIENTDPGGLVRVTVVAEVTIKWAIPIHKPEE